MEVRQRACPLCEQVMNEEDGAFVCGEHGKWQSYGARLLVRAPAAEATRAERVTMPWENLLPAV